MSIFCGKTCFFFFQRRFFALEVVGVGAIATTTSLSLRVDNLEVSVLAIFGFGRGHPSGSW